LEVELDEYLAAYRGPARSNDRNAEGPHVE